MQSIISQQDEVICKLDEEIQIIKVKLLSLENVISNSICDGAFNNLGNKSLDSVNGLHGTDKSTYYCVSEMYTNLSKYNLNSSNLDLTFHHNDPTIPCVNDQIPHRIYVQSS